METEELNTILMENRRMRKALKFIDRWIIPEIKDRDGRLVSYTCLKGSNGARDFMRNIASEALKGGE